MTESFLKELTDLINRHSLENESNTPDYILAKYLMNCLRAWNHGVNQRDKWYSVDLHPGCGLGSKGEHDAP